MTDSAAGPPSVDALVRDRSIESWLATYGLGPDQWALVFVRLKAFDRENSLRNQARINQVKLDRAHVESLAASLAEGAVFPPLVAYKGERGLVLIDGNHRLEVYAQAGVAWIAVYVVMSDNYVLLDLMTRAANIKLQPKPVTKEEQWEQVSALLGQGHSVAEVARSLGMKESTIKDHRRERDTKRRLKDAGVRCWDTLPTGVVGKLGQIQSDVSLKAVAELASEAKYSIEALSDLVNRVRDAGSEARSLEIVAAEREAYQKRVRDAKGKATAPAEPDATKIERWMRAISRMFLSGKSPYLMGYRHTDDTDRARAVLADLDHAAAVVLAEAERLIRRAAHAAEGPEAAE